MKSYDKQKMIQLQKLNSGGFARIYLDNANSDYILKINKKTLDKQEIIDTLRNEIYIYEYLKKHQLDKLTQIVKYVDNKETETYIQLRLARYDCDLSNYYKHSALCVDDIMYILYNMSEVLTKLHQVNVIHCDIKPSNILLKFTGFRYPNISVCDFGLAQIQEQQLNQIKGTNYFIDPQMIWSGNIHYSSDLWSLGITILYLLFDKNSIVYDHNGKQIMIQNRNFNQLSVDEIKQIKYDHDKEKSIQQYISHILLGIKNDLIIQMIYPLLQVDISDRITIKYYQEYLVSLINRYRQKIHSKHTIQTNQQINQNNAKDAKDILIHSHLSNKSNQLLNPYRDIFKQSNIKYNPNFQFITYMKQVNNLFIYVIENQQLVFRIQINNEQLGYVVITKDGVLFFSDKQLIITYRDIFKQYIEQLGFPQQYKTKIISFTEIPFIINIQLQLDSSKQSTQNQHQIKHQNKHQGNRQDKHQDIRQDNRQDRYQQVKELDTFMGLIVNPASYQYCYEEQKQELNSSQITRSESSKQQVDNYIFIIQIQEKQSYYMQIKDVKRRRGKQSEMLQNNIICNMRNVKIITKFCNFLKKKQNAQISEILTSLYKQIHKQINTNKQIDTDRQINKQIDRQKQV